MSLPPQNNAAAAAAAAMATKGRGGTAGFTTFVKPLTNFSGIVAQHVFSIVQSISPAKPTEQPNSSTVAKALDSLLHIADACGDDALICAARGIVETEFMREGGMQFSPERAELLHRIIHLFLTEPRSISFTTSICSIICSRTNFDSKDEALTVKTLLDFATQTKLPLETQIAIGIALVQHPVESIVTGGNSLLLYLFSDIIKNAKSSDKNKCRFVVFSDPNVYHTTLFVMKRDCHLAPFVSLVKYEPQKGVPIPSTLSLVVPSSAPTDVDNVTVLSTVTPASAMQDAGFGCTASPSVFKNFLSTTLGSRALTEKDVSDMLCVLSKSDSAELRDGVFIDFETGSIASSCSSWNVQAFATVIREFSSASHFDWVKILVGMDVPSFEQIDASGFNIVAQVYSICCPKEPFPFVQAYCTNVWRNRIAQLSMLRMALESEIDVLPRQATDNTAQTAKGSNERFNLAWGSPQYIDILLRLSDTDACGQVRRMFEQAWKQNSILLFRSLTSEEPRVTDCQLYRDLLAELADTLLVPHNNNGATLLALWNDCPKGVVDAMRVLYFTDRSKVATIVESAHFQSTNVKPQSDKYLLKALLDSQPLSFAIDIAVLSCQRGFLNLEQWLKEKAQLYGPEFIHASLNFLREKYEMKVTPGGIHAKGAASAYHLQDSVLKMIINLIPSFMTQDVMIDYKCFINDYNALNKPQQQQLQQAPVDSETQRLTNDRREFIQHIYNGDISPEDAVDDLRTRKPLFVRLVAEFFLNLMNLANQEEKVIDIFSQCFGLMAINGLLGNNWPQILLDAFQKDDPILNRFKFNVLTIIQPVLARYLPLCEQLAHFPAALEKCNPLHKILETEQILRAKTTNVNEAAFDDASFKVNNMTVDSVREDAAIIRKLFADSNMFPSALFIRKLVLPHVSRDEETHKLYESLLVMLNVPDIFEEAAKETVLECRKVIKSNLDDRRTQDSLQNLGHWLGHITLGRNKLIPRDLSLKSLLMSYMTKDKDVLHVITTFVTAVLSHAAGKPSLLPPNPWMVPLLHLLVQIYDREDVKEYTRFAIEDLFHSDQEDCLSLNLDMNDYRVVPTKEDLLRHFIQERSLNRSRAGQEFYQFVQEFHASFNAIEIVRNCINSLVLRDLACVSDEVQLRKIAEKTMMHLLNIQLQFALMDKIKALRSRGDYAQEFENLLYSYLMAEYTKEAEKELDRILSEPIKIRKQFKAMIATGKLPKDTVFQDYQYSNPMSSFAQENQAAVIAFYERFAIPEHPVQIAAPENPEVSMNRSADKSGHESIACDFGDRYRLSHTGSKEQRQKVLNQTCEWMLSNLKVFGDARYFIDAAVTHAEMACTQDVYVKYGKLLFFVNCLYTMLFMVQNPDKAAAASERSMILNFALDGFRASLAKHYGNGVGFDQRPYQLLLQKIIDVVYVENLEFDLAKPPTLHLFQLMCQLNPSNYPGFAFAWLDILSSKKFLSNLLALDADGMSAGEAAKELLVLFLQFMEPYLRAGELDPSMEQLYFGSLRLFLTLVNEGSELFVRYYNTFCDVIPPNCVQLRNLVLSALLPSMKPPNVATPGLKIDMIAGIRNPPPLPPHCTRALEEGHIIPDLESFLIQGAGSATFDRDLMTLLQPQRPTKYNVPAINALVLQCAIVVTTANCNSNNAFTLFKSLLQAFDAEGRMYLINAMANQLRFPNSHMLFYSHIMLKLFQSDLDNTIKDQMVRTGVERLYARPQPWGVMAFYRELVTDPEFDKFVVTLAPETRQFLDSFRRALLS